MKIKKPSKDLINFILYLLCIISISLIINHFIVQRVVVYGQSMEPTYKERDSLIVDKIFYKRKGLSRFDVIVFDYNGEKNFIKRIIGLPGETVRIDDGGYIYINGEILHENYGKEAMNNPGIAAQEIKLADDEYFVLGDNRNNSKDSRMIGPVKINKIIGRIIKNVALF